ncbi:MAG TPA: carboxypeptidase-like regulatory domain-containing protein [Candidatus Deferrimicrobiaceae bacterium]|nr:carboxypeptidase-like regulatory domain-containing protein [Candidatus Deferrimicrobiaceae bacterium]
MNKKIITVTLMALLAFAIVAPLQVYAQNTNLGVSILQVTPDERSGPVGTAVNIQGTIYQSNSSYQILLKSGATEYVVATGTSEGFYVNGNFTVPELPSGTYALILRDVGISVNSPAESFSVTSGYSISASSSNIQEGGSVTLAVSITGATLGTSYYANVKVSLVNSGTTYTRTILLGTPNTKGSVSAQVAFPDSSFDPSGSSTTYAGAYSYSFNSSLASGEFNVNILDQTSYHRGQTASIRAIGYEPNQAASITVTSVKTGTTIDTFSVTASSEGVITSSYVVSPNADIGDYTVKITPTGTQKTMQDTQTFSVPGYAIKVQTTNLAGDTVPDLSVQAVDATTNTASNATTDSDGFASFKFEKGTVVLTAYWNGINVGTTNITVSGDATFTMRCQLTNLKITVKNSAGLAIPFVNLNIQYNYQGTVSRTGTAQGQTGPSGSYTLKSALAGATYKVEASIYNQTFNPFNNTFSNLPSQPTVEVVLLCPDEDLTFSILGSSQAPIANARIELVELSSGLFYSTSTDGNGAASAQITFGIYRARIYKDNILVNETTVQAFDSGHKQITCTLYGIQVTVKVVDALGGPISTAQVTLNGPQKLSDVTKGDGTVTFDNIIGGSMQIIAQAQGAPDIYQAITTTVTQPGTVQLRMDKYIAFGSTLIPASLLVTIIIILLAVMGLLLVEILRRKKVNLHRQAKTSFS